MVRSFFLLVVLLMVSACERPYVQARAVEPAPPRIAERYVPDVLGTWVSATSNKRYDFIPQGIRDRFDILDHKTGSLVGAGRQEGRNVFIVLDVVHEGHLFPDVNIAFRLVPSGDLVGRTIRQPPEDIRFIRISSHPPACNCP